MYSTLSLKPAKPWQTHPRETGAALVVCAAALLAVAGVGGATPLPSAAADLPDAANSPGALPSLTPMQVRDFSAQTAMAVNAQIPIAGGGGPAALPFALGKVSTETKSRALECLTSALYYEAGQEGVDGQRAVAQVVLNRVRHPAFPNTVCGVVYEGSTRVTGCQFTFTCDGSMARRPVPAIWNRMRKIAWQMLTGYVYAPVGQATHYHANYVVPYWAPTLVKTSVEGVHLFYRWAGRWGRPSAFSQRWARKESDPFVLRDAALTAPRDLPATEEAVEAVAALEAAGAKVTEDNGRVRVLFSPEAREAANKVEVTQYVERVSASDNLRYALDGGKAAAEQPALGAPAQAPAPSPPASTPTAQ